MLINGSQLPKSSTNNWYYMQWTWWKYRGHPLFSSTGVWNIHEEEGVKKSNVCVRKIESSWRCWNKSLVDQILITKRTYKVYFRSQILEHSSIGEYWNISGVPVLPENVIFTFFRTCWCYSEAYNTGTQKWSSIVQYSCTSIWDVKYTFSKRTSGQQLFPFFFFPEMVEFTSLWSNISVKTNCSLYCILSSLRICKFTINDVPKQRQFVSSKKLQGRT